MDTQFLEFGEPWAEVRYDERRIAQTTQGTIMGTKLDSFFQHPIWLAFMLVVSTHIILDAAGVIPGPRTLNSPGSAILVGLNVLLFMYAANGLYDHFRKNKQPK